MVDDPDIRVEYLALQLRMVLRANPPKEREKQVAAMNLAYGNLAASSHNPPSRLIFGDIAIERYGWTEEEFQQWANEPFRTVWRHHEAPSET